MKKQIFFFTGKKGPAVKGREGDDAKGATPYRARPHRWERVADAFRPDSYLEGATWRWAKVMAGYCRRALISDFPLPVQKTKTGSLASFLLKFPSPDQSSGDL